MRRLLAAVRFLTIVPLPGGEDTDAQELGSAAPLFPVVGLLIGAVTAAAAVGLWNVFPPAVAAVLLSVAMLAVSGGFHMDGLSDTADGFFSSRGKQRMLEIMKDSRVGAMGVIAILCVFALKVAALASLEQADAVKAAFLMPVAGRCGLTLGINGLPSARPDGGLGRLFCQKRSWRQAVWATVVLAAAGWFALAAVAAALAVIGLFSLYCYRKIGGATGDTLGATCELAETAVAVAFTLRCVRIV